MKPTADDAQSRNLPCGIVASAMRAWRRNAASALLLLMIGVAACGGEKMTAVTTATSIPVTPVEQTIPVTGNATLGGTLYGHGSTALIFSNQIDNVSSEWGGVPAQFAAHGYAALTYQYRDATDDTTRLADLRAAITFMQQHGAQKIVLIGASIGGLVTVAVAAQMQVQAIVLLSAPDAYGTILLNAAQVGQITAPALVVESDEDEYVPDAQQIYAWLISPKTLKIYANDDSHGVALFSNHADLFPLVLQFLQQHGAK